MTTTGQPFSPLIADIISASVAMTHDTANLLIASLTQQAEDARAELDAVRAGVNALLDGPYQPSSAALVRALYPPAKLVDRFRPGGAS